MVLSSPQVSLKRISPPSNQIRKSTWPWSLIKTRGILRSPKWRGIKLISSVQKMNTSTERSDISQEHEGPFKLLISQSNILSALEGRLRLPKEKKEPFPEVERRGIKLGGLLTQDHFGELDDFIKNFNSGHLHKGILIIKRRSMDTRLEEIIRRYLKREFKIWDGNHVLGEDKELYVKYYPTN